MTNRHHHHHHHRGRTARLLLFAHAWCTHESFAVLRLSGHHDRDTGAVQENAGRGDSLGDQMEATGRFASQQ